MNSIQVYFWFGVENNMAANNSFIGQKMCDIDIAFRFIQFKGGVVCIETDNLAKTKSPKKSRKKKDQKLVSQQEVNM